MTKVPLHSIEAEMSLLGSMLLHGKVMPEIDAIVSVEDFFRPAHQLIFKAVQDCGKFGVDIVTLKNKLNERNQLNDCGGTDYLIQLAEYVPAISNAEYYAKIVAEKAVLRRLESATGEIQNIIHDPEIDGIDDRVSRSIQAIEVATNRKQLNDFSTLGSYVMKASNSLDKMMEGGTTETGIPTTFEGLDEIITGLLPGDFILVGARPSMGKTALGVQLAISSAKMGNPSAIYSAEMTGEKLTKRLIAQIAGYSVSIFNRPPENDKIASDLADAMDEIYSLPVGIDESSELNPDTMFAQCKAFQKSHGGGHCVFVLDYLQYITQPRKGENQNDATTRVSRICKKIAKSLGCTFIALCQLSRDCEKREDKRPQLSDLRDSGSLEQDADIVAFIYRDEYYRAKKEGRTNEAYQSEAELLVRKNRNGPLGIVTLAFRPSQTKFLSVKA